MSTTSATSSFITMSDHQDLLAPTSADENKIYTLKGHDTAVNSVSFEPSSGLIASGDDRGAIFIWDMAQSEEMNIGTAKHHKGEVLDLTWLDSNQILSSSSDTTAKIYDVERGRVVRTVSHGKGAINCVAASHTDANPQLFVTGGENGYVAVWDQRFKDVPVHEIKTKYPICSLACNSDMSQLFVSGVNDSIYGFDFKRGAQFVKLIGHCDVVTSLDLSSDGSTLTSFAADNTIRTWDVRPAVSSQREAAGRVLNKYEGTAVQNRNRQQLQRHRFITMKSSLTASKQFMGIAAASADGNCILYDLQTPNQQPIKLANHQGAVHDIDSWNQWLVTCSIDGTVVLGALKL